MKSAIFHKVSKADLCRLLGLFICLYCLSSFYATAQTVSGSKMGDIGASLVRVQSTLSDKLDERSQLREQLKSAEKDAQIEIESELQRLAVEIKALRIGFEQLAVGTVELGVFDDTPKDFNWREEVTQILMPVVENLKALTEKPRKIERLRSQIERKQQQLDASEQAIQSIRQLQSGIQDTPSSAALIDLSESWMARQSSLVQDMELARTQLIGLQTSSESWWQTGLQALKDFIKGRGLTLLMAIAASTTIWYAMRLILKLYEKSVKSKDRKTFRTRQRLARYAFKLLTGLLIMVALLMVFYTRGDMLLMALSFLVVTGVVLGLRNTIPKFLAETRLLLNIGSLREDERVMYDGLPWQVVSLNVFTVLRNPEITGVIRLPLESLAGMTSRPAGNESWFPSSKGDYIVLPDARLLKVLSQTPERVELENLVGTKTTIPSREFYHLTFDNLSRGENYAVVGVFGIDYRHQSISIDVVPGVLRTALQQALQESDVAEYVTAVAVELKEAGASSLDFWLCVTMKSDAARAYTRLNRLIQQVCVSTCTDQNWGIPFPQLTLHQA